MNLRELGVHPDRGMDLMMSGQSDIERAFKYNQPDTERAGKMVLENEASFARGRLPFGTCLCWPQRPG